MSTFCVHTVEWCTRHGHPVLALRTDDDRYFVVAIRAEDAELLAPDRSDAAHSPSPQRFLTLIDELTMALGGLLTEVRLHIGSDDLLRASVAYQHRAGTHRFRTYLVDAIALAQRNRLPLQIADEDLARIPLAPLTRARPVPVQAEVPAAFRAVIDGLDLNALGESAAPAPSGED